MSQSILLGNGWHPPLFRSEINALFGELKILHPRIVLLDQPIDETFLTRVSRAALVDDVINLEVSRIAQILIQLQMKFLIGVRKIYLLEVLCSE